MKLFENIITGNLLGICIALPAFSVIFMFFGLKYIVSNEIKYGAILIIIGIGMMIYFYKLFHYLKKKGITFSLKL